MDVADKWDIRRMYICSRDEHLEWNVLLGGGLIFSSYLDQHSVKQWDSSPHG
jgi:hypothetical protein